MTGKMYKACPHCGKSLEPEKPISTCEICQKRVTTTWIGDDHDGTINTCGECHDTYYYDAYRGELHDAKTRILVGYGRSTSEGSPRIRWRENVEKCAGCISPGKSDIACSDCSRNDLSPYNGTKMTRSRFKKIKEVTT